MTTYSTILDRIQTRRAQVGIIGLGYVGLPLAMTFCAAGFEVTGFDVDREKIRLLHAGTSYIRHFNAQELPRVIASQQLRPTHDFSQLSGMDAILICVPTPLDNKRQPDLGAVEATVKQIAQNIRPGQLIILESTTYPGTTDEIVVPLLETAGVVCRERAKAFAAAARSTTSSESAVPDRRVYVAYSPEREDPGNAHFTTRMIPKVVGGLDQQSSELAQALYATAFERVVPVSSARAAEMTKILENTYRCVNIALVNELNQLCRRMGLDIYEIIQAAATKPFGFQPFYPGPGMGGHCIPIDPFYLSWKARDYDFTTRFIELAGEINVEMPYRVVEAISSALNFRKLAVNQSKILILGIAYKKNIDDLRESPALKVIDLLHRRGALISYHDPFCPQLRPHHDFQHTYDSVAFTPANAADYDCVVVMTDHDGLDYRGITQHARLLVDTRNATHSLQADNVVHF